MIWFSFILWVSAAHASPSFVASSEDIQNRAQKAWRAGVQCTGWEPETSKRIDIRSGRVEGSFDSYAVFKEDQLIRIELGPDQPERDLLHELAHAWARRGPTALTEGRADWLADCMVSMNSSLGPLDPDHGGRLVPMLDLRKWQNSRSFDDAALQRNAYIGAARWIRVLTQILPISDIFPQNGELKWRPLEKLLLKAGPKGVIALSSLEGGLEEQIKALSDDDGDGQVRLAEILSGTQPNKWDSDGDGWWDGAPRSSQSTGKPLPRDGSPICSGYTSGQKGADVFVATGGNWRGRSSPPVRVLAGEHLLVDDPRTGVFVPPHQPILLMLDHMESPPSGGAWATVRGQGLLTTWNCHSTSKYTIWVRDPQFTPFLYAFENALREHLNRADAMIGSPQRRLVIHLGAPGMDINPWVVQLSSGFLQWAESIKRPDAAAALAIALQRVWQQSPEDWSWESAEALARAMMDNPPPTLLVTPP